MVGCAWIVQVTSRTAVRLWRLNFVQVPSWQGGLTCKTRRGTRIDMAVHLGFNRPKLAAKTNPKVTHKRKASLWEMLVKEIWTSSKRNRSRAKGQPVSSQQTYSTLSTPCWDSVVRLRSKVAVIFANNTLQIQDLSKMDLSSVEFLSQT